VLIAFVGDFLIIAGAAFFSLFLGLAVA